MNDGTYDTNGTGVSKDEIISSIVSTFELHLREMNIEQLSNLRSIFEREMVRGLSNTLEQNKELEKDDLVVLNHSESAAAAKQKQKFKVKERVEKNHATLDMFKK